MKIALFFIFPGMVELRNDKPVRFRRTTAEILQLLDEFYKSGMKAGEFCKVHGLHPANFHKWRSRHKDKLLKNKKPSGFAPVKVLPVSKPVSSSLLFAEVSGIRLYQPVPASFLKELLS